MTWTLKLRGSPTGTVRLEYLCPVHGRFELDVDRATTPDWVSCPELAPGACREHREVPQTLPCEDCATETTLCNEMAWWSPSIGACRVKLGEVSQGKFQEPPSPGCLDTRALADGMPMGEWKAQRDKLRQEQRRKQIKEMMR